jgi:hypothetical protein
MRLGDNPIRARTRFLGRSPDKHINGVRPAPKFLIEDAEKWDRVAKSAGIKLE